MALNRKIAYIDLTTGNIDIAPIPLEIRRKFLGGRGLDAYLLYNHTKKGCDPLGPGNALIISGGLLTATCASATARTHIMAKSPLTGLLGSANMGGFFAPEMAWAGFHHLVITGKAKKPVYLFLHNGEIEIRDAAHLWGKTTTETQWAIREELGDEEVKSCVIGPAGENLVRYANVMTGIKNSAGRTGMGCVMGLGMIVSGSKSYQSPCHSTSSSVRSVTRTSRLSSNFSLEVSIGDPIRAIS